jgi:hypothetical protein
MQPLGISVTRRIDHAGDFCRSLPRTLDAVERAAVNALQQFKPDQCANFFAHAGSNRIKRYLLESVVALCCQLTR